MSDLKVKKILFSQDAPVFIENTPYAELLKKYRIKINFFKFFRIDPIPSQEFKKSGINILDYREIIMTSKYAVDHFFRVVKELKIVLPIDIKFFCINEPVAIHVGKYVKYKKTQIEFQDNANMENLWELIMGKRRNRRELLIPCALESSSNPIIDWLDNRNVKYTKAEVFKILLAEVHKEINIYDYNMLVFFSPYGIQALMQSYPDYKQENMVIAAMGSQAIAAAEKAGLTLQIAVSTAENPSIFTAIDKYLGTVIDTKRQPK